MSAPIFRAQRAKLPASYRAAQIIQWYLEGSMLDDEQEHILHDTAAEHGQILDNVASTAWFRRALTENIEALDGTP